MTNIMDFTVKGVKTIIIKLLHMLKNLKENINGIRREMNCKEINQMKYLEVKNTVSEIKISLI